MIFIKFTFSICCRNESLQKIEKKRNKEKDFTKKESKELFTKRLIPLIWPGTFLALRPPSKTTGRKFTSDTGRVHWFSERKSKSLWVTRPINLAPIFPVSVMGMPEYPCFSLTALTSDTRAVGGKTNGSIMKPCSYFWEFSIVYDNEVDSYY